MAEISAVTVGATSTMVVEANPQRRRLVLCNNSDEDMYIAPGGLAVSTQGLPLKASGGVWDDEETAITRNFYRGMYTAICTSGGKVLSVTEWSY